MSRNIDYSKRLTEDEAEYIRQRPWIITDLDLQGVEIKWPDAEADENADEEEDEEEVDYRDLSVADLKAELKARQEAGHNINALGGKKEDLILALEQDDAQIANSSQEG